ncbi:hypothetical protein BZG36_04675, partial [Bifiguratus adelaidae]
MSTSNNTDGKQSAFSKYTPNFKDFAFNFGKTVHDLKGQYARMNPNVSSDTRALYVLTQEEKNIVNSHRAIAYQRTGAGKLLREWGYDEGADLADVTAKLELLLNKMSEVEVQFSNNYETYRKTLKQIKAREGLLGDAREKRKSLTARITGLQKSQPNSPKIQEFQYELNQLEQDSQQQESELADFKRFAVREAFYVNFNAQYEYAEKMSILAGFGKYLVDTIDVTPTQGQQRRPYQSEHQTDQIVRDAFTAVDGWKPVQGDHRPTMAEKTTAGPGGLYMQDNNSDEYVNDPQVARTTQQLSQTNMGSSQSLNQPGAGIGASNAVAAGTAAAGGIAGAAHGQAPSNEPQTYPSNAAAQGYGKQAQFNVPPPPSQAPSQSYAAPENPPAYSGQTSNTGPNPFEDQKQPYQSQDQGNDSYPAPATGYPAPQAHAGTSGLTYGQAPQGPTYSHADKQSAEDGDDIQTPFDSTRSNPAQNNAPTSTQSYQDIYQQAQQNTSGYQPRPYSDFQSQYQKPQAYYNPAQSEAQAHALAESQSKAAYQGFDDTVMDKAPPVARSRYLSQDSDSYNRVHTLDARNNAAQPLTTSHLPAIQPMDTSATSTSVEPQPIGGHVNGSMQQPPGAGARPRRQKSLVRPERERIDPNHRQYHYRQRAVENLGPDQVAISSTGNAPLGRGLSYRGYNNYDQEDEPRASAGGNVLRSLSQRVPLRRGKSILGREEPRGGTIRRPNGRQASIRQRNGAAAAAIGATGEPVTDQHLLDENTHKKNHDAWMIYCYALTCCFPGNTLSIFGKHDVNSQRAFREKIGLLSLIVLICAAVGFLTFGFTQAVCPAPPLTFHAGSINSGYFIINGWAYQLASWKGHPPIPGLPDTVNNTNPLYNSLNAGGMDGSFLFQTVNQNCLTVIQPKSSAISTIKAQKSSQNSNYYDVPTYFPCRMFNPNNTVPPDSNTYLNYSGCHLTPTARNAYYNLEKYGAQDANGQYEKGGQVYYDWTDVNSTKHLVVYNGMVLNIDLLKSLPMQYFDIPANGLLQTMMASNASSIYGGTDITHVIE